MSEPKTNASIKARHDAAMLPCVINYYEEPISIARGEGTTVWDVEGREYLDFFGGILTVSLGHCHGPVADAIVEQVRTMQHSSTLYPSEQMVSLAEELAAIAPGRLSRSFFTSSGTEADETAILLAMIHTGSHEIVALRHCYSGRSMLALSLQGHAPWRLIGTQIPGLKHMAAPYCYRCPFGLEYPSCDVKCAHDLKELIETTTNGRPAALICEPILGVGGFVVPPPEYFKVVSDIIHEYGGLFIADEVQTGFGRTGEKWFGIEHWDVEPDIMTMAKGIANGVPMGATITRDDIAESFTGLSLSTYGGNPVSSVAARATLASMQAEGVPERAERLGKILRSRLEAAQARHPRMGDVRGMGLMQAVEFVTDPATKEHDPAATSAVTEAAKRRGVLIGKGGLKGNVLRLSPPMLISEDNLLRACDVLDECFDEVLGG